MTLLLTAVTFVAVFSLVWWVGSIWVLGAEVLDEHSE